MPILFQRLLSVSASNIEEDDKLLDCAAVFGREVELEEEPPAFPALSGAAGVSASNGSKDSSKSGSMVFLYHFFLNFCNFFPTGGG